MVSTGNQLMRGTPPQHAQKGDCPPQEGSFHFASRLQEKEPKLQKATMMSDFWKFMCHLSMYQFIEISICALEEKKFKHFDVERPVV